MNPLNPQKAMERLLWDQRLHVCDYFKEKWPRDFESDCMIFSLLQSATFQLVIASNSILTYGIYIYSTVGFSESNCELKAEENVSGYKRGKTWLYKRRIQAKHF